MHDITCYINEFLRYYRLNKKIEHLTTHTPDKPTSECNRRLFIQICVFNLHPWIDFLYDKSRRFFDLVKPKSIVTTVAEMIGKLTGNLGYSGTQVVDRTMINN